MEPRPFCEGATLSHDEWARVVAIAERKLGWTEAELRETLRTGVLPRVTAGTGSPLRQHPLFTEPPPLPPFKMHW